MCHLKIVMWDVKILKVVEVMKVLHKKDLYTKEENGVVTYEDQKVVQVRG